MQRGREAERGVQWSFQEVALFLPPPPCHHQSSTPLHQYPDVERVVADTNSREQHLFTEHCSVIALNCGFDLILNLAGFNPLLNKSLQVLILPDPCIHNYLSQYVHTVCVRFWHFSFSVVWWLYPLKVNAAKPQSVTVRQTDRLFAEITAFTQKPKKAFWCNYRWCETALFSEMKSFTKPKK